MRCKFPMVLVAVAGLAGATQAQTSPAKSPTSNRAVAGATKTPIVKDTGFSVRVAASDNCADAPVVSNGESITFDTSTATNDYAGTCGASTTSADMWAKVVATENITVTVATCGLTGGDTVLTALRGCGGPQILCLDDFCGLETQITFPLDAGQSAWVRVAGFANSFITGSAAVTTAPRGGGGGGNDNCADATVVTAGTYDYDLNSASNDFAGSCGASGSSPDVWYKYTTGAVQEQVTASTCGLSSSDTVLAWVDGCGGSEIACLDDACGLQTSLSTIVAANTTVWLRLAGYNGTVHAGQVNFSSIPVEPPANDSCATAAAIVPGTPASFDTSFADDDGAASCGLGGDPGQGSVWYTFTADRDGAVEVLTCDGTAFDTIVSMYDGCDGTEVGCNDDSCGLQSYFSTNVTNGTTYKVRVSGYGLARGAGSVAVNYVEPCVITRPSGAVDEAEDCQAATDTDTNGGCNIPSGAVQTVTNNSIVWGTASTFFDGNTGFDTRDTDWYELTLDSDQDLTIRGRAEFDLRLFILDAVCQPTIIATGNTGRPCNEIEVTATLTAGTYRIFAGPNFFAGFPCDGAVDNHYILTIGNPSGGCIADFNNDSFVDFFDYADYVACFEGEPCPPGRTADVNGDNFVDFFDYADFVDAFETGC